MNPLWDNLPFLRKVSRILLIFFYSISIVMLIFGVPLLIIALLARGTFDAEDRAFLAGMAGFGAIVFPLSLIWWKLEIREWKLRYLFLGKEFGIAFSELLAHYGSFSDEVKILKKQCRECYHVSGKLFGEDSGSFWQFRERDGVKNTLALVCALDECCRNHEGLEAFLRKCDREEFTIYDKTQEKDLPMDNYAIYARLSGGIFSGGLGHLFARVFALCSFTLYDNGLSPVFTARNEENRKKLAEVYSPILFSYEEEIGEVRKRLEALADR